MTVIEGVRTWLGDCTGFTAGYIDALPSAPGSYSVESVPCTETVRRYFDGSALRQFLFVVAGREYLDGEPELSSENMEVFEELSAWMEEKTAEGDMPDIGTGRHPLRIGATGRAYPISRDGHGTARYQMQCRLEYFEEGTR